MEELIRLLHSVDCSLVIRNGEIRTFSERGVAALYRLLKEEPIFLKGASVADKVVGKGAAALMILGGVRELYTDVISEPALALLQDAGIPVEFKEKVAHIQNRARTGFCPVETLCREAATAEECLPLIEGFMENLNSTIGKQVK
ncbi:MAG: DUF1893 domain-containing protein [Marinifilaceae bacterium]|nr:DUF1893 domain-containing protein [Marinifilaceae bacterium]